MEGAVAYVNGVFSPVEEARVSIEDRGFQFGDGVYEVIAVYDRRPFLMDRHMVRLRQSCRAIGLEYDFDGRPLDPIVREGLKRSGLRDVMVYIQLTRGVAPRSHVIPPGMTPTIVMTFRALPRLTPEQRQQGARIMTTPETRWSKCYIKAVTLLPNILARNEAVAKGFDDALFVTTGGEVRECTSSNVFLVRDGRLLLPPRDESVLHGVTQGFLLECAESIGLRIDETVCTIETLKAAEEAFLSSTTAEVWGITSIDGKPVADGRVGPITRRLHETFQSRVRGEPVDAAGTA